MQIVPKIIEISFTDKEIENFFLELQKPIGEQKSDLISQIFLARSRK